MPLNPNQVEDYMRGFFGYGNPEGRWWFVGPEEGGGRTVDEVCARVQAWHDAGENVLDLCAYCDHVGHGLQQWFRENPRPPIQRTWAALIRTVFSAEGRLHEGLIQQREQIRSYQRVQLGRADGCTYLSEILPLPSRGTGHWNYTRADWWEGGQVPDFVTGNHIRGRNNALNHCRDARLTYFRQTFNALPPGHRIVIAYGLPRQYFNIFFAAIGFDINWVPLDGLHAFCLTVHHASQTVVVQTRHPITRGLRNDYWNAIGAAINELLPPELNVGE